MKIMMKPIDMIAWFSVDGIPTPIKYRTINENGSYVTIKVDRVLFSETEKLAGNKMIIFTCQSVIKGIEKRYELKYELNTCKWFLFKM